MGKFKFGSPLCLLFIIFQLGCSAVPEHNYIGMTKTEVAEHLEKHAFRSRWSRNRFAIHLPRSQKYSHYFRKAQDVVKNQAVMAADQWHCDFFPQRHWLWGWNGIFAKWYFRILEFKDDRVVKQRLTRNYYWVHGLAGKSPYPDFPKNFHQVNENIYRSGQPDKDEFWSLYTFNCIRSVLNLRENNSDRDEVNAINRNWNNAITLYEISLDTGNITEADLYKILSVIRDAPKPLLIHCWHGSDRTGCAVAAYRIAFEDWSVEDAISELMKPEYGHHKNIYTNIPELLRNADWQKIKAAVSKSKK